MEDEKNLSYKVTQVIQLTRCTEDLAALTLHQFNYEVGSTVEFLLDNDLNHLENVITTKQRARRSLPHTSSQTVNDNENCLTAEPTDSQIPTSRRKNKGDDKTDQGRGIESGDSRKGGSGRRGRNRLRRNIADLSKSNNTAPCETHNKENEETAENGEKDVDRAQKRFDGSNEKYVPRRRFYLRGGATNHRDSHGMSEAPPSGPRSNRFHGYRGLRMRGGMHRGGGFRSMREEGGGRVFTRREPAGEVSQFQRREDDYRQEADGWDASEGYALTSSHDNVAEVPSWSGEPLVLTNSKAAAQCVDQLMDANDASIQSILSQYTTRPSCGDSSQSQDVVKEAHDSSNRENVSLSGLASVEDEKVDWASWETSPTPGASNLFNSVKNAPSSNALQSATQALKEMIGVNGPLIATTHVHSSQPQSQQVSSQVNPEDPEVLRRGIFQRPQRSKPPPQPQKAPERPTDLPSQLRPEPLGSYSSGFRFGDDDLEENYLNKVIAPVFSKSAVPTAVHGTHPGTMGAKDAPNCTTHMPLNIPNANTEHSTQLPQQRSQNYSQEATMHIRQQLGLMTTPSSSASDPVNARSPSQLTASNADKQNLEMHPSVQHSVPQIQQSQVASVSNMPSNHKSVTSNPSMNNAAVSSQDNGPNSSSYHVLDSYDRPANATMNNIASNSPPSIQQQSAIQVNPQRMMPTPLMGSSFMPSTSSYNQPLSQFPQQMQPAVTGATPQLDLSNPNALLQALATCLNHPQFQHMQSPILQALLQQSQFYPASGGNPSPPMNAANVSGMMASGSHPPGLMPPHTATTGGYASVSLSGNITPHQTMPPHNMMNLFAPQVTLSTPQTVSADATVALGQRNPYYSGMAAQHYFTQQQQQQQQQHHLLLSAAAQSNSNASLGVNNAEQQQAQMDESNSAPSMAEQQRNAMSSGSNAVDKYSNLKHMYPSPMKQQQSMAGVNNQQSQAAQNNSSGIFASSNSGTVGMDYHHAAHHTTPQGGIYIPQNATGNTTSAPYHHHPGMPTSFVAASYNAQPGPQGSGNPHYIAQAVLMQPTGSVGGPKIPAMPHNAKNSVTSYGAWMNTAPNPGASASGNN